MHASLNSTHRRTEAGATYARLESYVHIAEFQSLDARRRGIESRNETFSGVLGKALRSACLVADDGFNLQIFSNFTPRLHTKGAGLPAHPPFVLGPDLQKNLRTNLVKT